MTADNNYNYMKLSQYFQPIQDETYATTLSSKRESYHLIIVNLERKNPDLCQKIVDKVSSKEDISDEILSEAEDELIEISFMNKESVENVLKQIRNVSESEFNFDDSSHIHEP